ncbi:Polycystic kidney disease protein 1-like 2 PC1-like 2 protein Polycystin-1L2 Precursor [Larimichthys crocea]|uniref:Polycystic kidney disease protein 1-like 2 PC1-like 2 protein Polycystin-1L2 n=1 Tax=Larimichthys crocea TaxID=215358 RepID=A0A6G0J733_LARCR|nr:Polycystic kidney disease protein 1-like 2 PC1-like 2 protein Polycystin-1L2 Precursor [Larimichthys crocea]
MQMPWSDLLTKVQRISQHLRCSKDNVLESVFLPLGDSSSNHRLIIKATAKDKSFVAHTTITVQVLDYTDNSNSSVDGLKIVVEAAVARMNKLGILSGETLGQMFHSVGNQLNGQSDKKTKQKRQKILMPRPVGEEVTTSVLDLANYSTTVINISSVYTTLVLKMMPSKDPLPFKLFLGYMDYPTDTNYIVMTEMPHQEQHKVGVNTTDSVTQCLCNHLTFFGSSFFVTPNLVDPSRTAELFATFAENPVVVCFVGALFVVYLLVVVWARRKDVNDVAKVKVTVLEDNDPIDDYCYLLSISTGYSQALQQVQGMKGFLEDQLFTFSCVNQDEVTQKNILEYLFRNKWLDMYTRAIFVEFTVYNANVNLFCIVTLLLESTGVGAFQFNSDLQSVRLYPSTGGLHIFVMIAEIIYLLFILYYMFLQGKLMKQQRWAYFRSKWNLLELTIILLTWSAVAVFIQRTLLGNRDMTYYQNHKDQFPSFYETARADLLLQYLIAFLVLLSTIKLWHLLRLNPKMNMITATLQRAWSDISSFLVVIVIMLVAYSIAVLNGTPLLGGLLFGSCIVFMTFVVLNLLISVILVAFNQEQIYHKPSDEEEIVDLMLMKICNLFGIKYKNTKDTPGADVKGDSDLTLNNGKNIINSSSAGVDIFSTDSSVNL